MAKDIFTQLSYLSVTESAANTLTFAGLSVFSNVLSQRGMIIHRVEYDLPAGTVALMVANADAIKYGLTGSDGMTSVSLDDPEAYDINRITRVDIGTAASGFYHNAKLVNDFTTLPGGGLLVPADRLYIYVEGVSLATAATAKARVRYTILDMSAADFLELAQSLRVLK